jgi:ADP-ribosylglycohydrolase
MLFGTNDQGSVLRLAGRGVGLLSATAWSVAEGSFRHKQPPAIEGSGWVVKSLEAALWAFHDADTFEEAVLRAVKLGDDADTTGAICGQLAGASWGESPISASLRSGADGHARKRSGWHCRCMMNL